MRVGELVGIRVEDVDTQRCKIFINRGKGGKDRSILFPESFRLVLRSHLQANPKNRFLFESQPCTPFTPRRLQQVVQGYRDRAGIAHLFRHQRSLEVYQHLSLDSAKAPRRGFKATIPARS